MRTITVTNQKGGTGKTTTAAAIGTGLMHKGYRVLFIDLDGQADLSDSMRADASGMGAATVMDVLEQKKPTVSTVTAAIQDVVIGDLHGGIMAASPALAGADKTIIEVGKDHRIRKALSLIADSYDFCVIDTPPALGIATVNALTAADIVVIPAKADYYSLKATGNLYSTIEAVKEYNNPDMVIGGILLTGFTPRTIISRDMAELLEQTASMMQTKVYDTKIRVCSALSEAQAMHEDIFTYNPKSNAAIDYGNLIKEILMEQ